ncbi:putative isomerase [Sulfurimicrobium lacus]|uniref:Putative isomerase n=1 Tax=Sulfurimicrobium lacus TaxID=2715678 RepID=A0A6F8V8T9_9PROT|nr:PhzF family phenazine biosynthesis protein [Sulfurimicrobium lacus]BCB26108.1 putative isomerase [Sulfurimicrobium lacus]
MPTPLYQVDAFTDRLFSGNPAAVCPLEAWPADGWMQAVAAENNLSETAFLVGGSGRYGLRWFTPATEVDLCGHATLAAAYVIFNFLETELDEVTFDTRSGELHVRRDGDWLRMDFPAQPPMPCPCPDELTQGLGQRPRGVLRADKYLAIFDTEAEIRSLKPDMEILKRLDLMGIIASAPGSDADFVSRFFAPKVGVPEDPVTGSAHCMLTPYWAERLGKTTLLARQVSRRGGEIHCTLKGGRVELAGQAVLFLRGEIMVN